ncbi:telomere binding protein [Knufia peltigerae]|uniref:Telomere binding protein n=1 Tax=Knufia peltigerae TaxID=1002370 RepID=A0AA38XMF6_9EURO|nr:telomere binding protein [Knufia peltigerae]
MDDLLKPIKTSWKVQNNIDKFESMSLKDTPSARPGSAKSKVSILDLDNESNDGAGDQFSIRPSIDSSHTSISASSDPKKHKSHDSTAFLQKSYLDNSPPPSLSDDAREVLKSQPDSEDLIAVLQYLQYGIQGRHDFNIRIPSPKASQIINVLVTTTVPDQWLHLRSSDLSKTDALLKKLLLSCLKSVAGIGALLMQIKQLTTTNSQKTNPVLEDAISVVGILLSGNGIVKELLIDATTFFPSETQRRVYWQEVTSLLAGSKVLSTIAQALAKTEQSDERNLMTSWLGDGAEYSRWLGKNISTAATACVSMSFSGIHYMNMLCQLLKRGLGLGYRDALATELYTMLLFRDHALWTVMHTLVSSLPSHDQKSLFDTILCDLARKHLGGNLSAGEKACLDSKSPAIGGVAAMIKGLVENNILLQTHLTHWLTSATGQYLGLGLDSRRAVIASLSTDKAQGRIDDFDLDKLEIVLEKSLEAFGNKLQMQHDPILQQEGSVDDLLKAPENVQRPPPVQKPSSRQRPVKLAARAQPTAKITAIEELSTDDEGDDPELRPYPRPNNDLSDSDDDPTLVNRNKPTAPVYITSLIKQINATDDVSTVELALRTAPSLIRRKAGFGDELSSNLLPLASALLNLQEGMSQQELQRFRLEALIECFVSEPVVMGPWIANMYFGGDFSLFQRGVLLTVLGLGARQIAGIDDEQDNGIAPMELGEKTFPSNRLPPQLESIFAPEKSPINTISTTLSRRTLQPMALTAADKLSGPDILKVRTFSSRMAVAAKQAAKTEARSKRVPKDLHKLLAESVYLPLCSRSTLLFSSLEKAPYLANSTLLHPSMVKLNIQTLTVIISTLGPNAVQLETVTRESLLLLTAIHTISVLTRDPIVLPAILHLLLTVLDLNIEAGATSEERLVTDFGSMIAELSSWAATLGEQGSIPEVHGEEGLGMSMPWPVLVAGIQVKWQEVGRKFQGRMLGLMATTDFDSF